MVGGIFSAEDMKIMCLQKLHNNPRDITHYRQTSSIKRIKYQNWNVSRLFLQLSLSNPLKPGVQSRMEM